MLHKIKPKVLVVDDTPANLIAMRSVLHGLHVEVIEASSGNEALQLTLVHDFALAVLDVQMPGMDGFEIAQLMRGSNDTKHIPVIFVTANLAEEEDKVKGYESGAVDYITKPINKSVLRSKVNVFLELYTQKKRLEHLNATLDEINTELMLARKKVEQDFESQSVSLTLLGKEIQPFTSVIASMARQLLGSQLTNEQQQWAEMINNSSENLMKTLTKRLG